MESYELDLSYNGFAEDPRPKMFSIPLQDIAVIPGWNPRSNPVPSRDLIDSVGAMGVTTPIKVRWRSNGDRGKEYVIDGERRYWAAKKAGLAEIPAIHYGELDDTTALLIAVASNENRKNMSTSDRVHCSYRLQREGADTKQIAAAMGTSLRVAQRYVKVNGLADEVRQLVVNGKLAAHVAASLDHPLLTDKKRAELLAVLPGMPSREAIALINKAKRNKAKSVRVTESRNKFVNHPVMLALTAQLAEVEEEYGESCCTVMARRVMDCLAGSARVEDVFVEWQK